MKRVPVTLRVSWFVPPWAGAWVPWRRAIIVRRREYVTPTLVAHELAHVLQAEAAAARLPWPWALVYAWQWLVTGMRYSSMPFEVEARAAESEPFYRAWARDLLEVWGGS